MKLTPEYLRRHLIGADAPFCTPFGPRLMTYCDYTASGRTLRFVEKYLMRLQRHYANTHTEDDMTGRSMTRLLHDAEQAIKRHVGAGEDDVLIATGTGATGAINKLQQILGIYLPPGTRRRIESLTGQPLADLREQWPVVFIGPYEHHSNEISWRDGLCEVVEVELDARGHIDLDHLQALLTDPRYAGRQKIGSFSAASNVTGLISPVRELAALLHRHDALAFFDYAASAPYVPIDMHPADATAENDTHLDAVFISPHKFIGGPGSSGILVFNRALYDRCLPPTVSGGGTVSYVARHQHDFIEDIEEREKAGTPGVLQVLRAALSFEIKARVGTAQIEAIEQRWLKRAFEQWQAHPRIEILGDPEPENRVAIVSFNIRTPEGRYLHPRFVTVLLNDLFGIQSRAGCSCAGPYGHRLLGIGEEESEHYRCLIGKGYEGIKPGWCRLGFHYTMDEAEVDFIIEAVAFIAEHGARFLPWYRFCVKQACWQHIQEPESCPQLSLDDAFQADDSCPQPLPVGVRQQLYRQYFEEARQWAEAAEKRPSLSLEVEDEEVAQIIQERFVL